MKTLLTLSILLLFTGPRAEDSREKAIRIIREGRHFHYTWKRDNDGWAMDLYVPEEFEDPFNRKLREMQSDGQIEGFWYDTQYVGVFIMRLYTNDPTVKSEIICWWRNYRKAAIPCECH